MHVAEDAVQSTAWAAPAPARALVLAWCATAATSANAWHATWWPARGIDEMEPLAKVRGGPRLLFRRLLPPRSASRRAVQCSAVARLSKLWCGGLCLST